jgi:hypothetical protein
MTTAPAINVVVPDGTTDETCALVRRAVEGAIAARDEQWQRVIEAAVNAVWREYRPPSVDGQRSAADLALDVIGDALPDTVAAANATKVQRIEHDDAGRIVAITSTAA